MNKIAGQQELLSFQNELKQKVDALDTASWQLNKFIKDSEKNFAKLGLEDKMKATYTKPVNLDEEDFDPDQPEYLNDEFLGELKDLVDRTEKIKSIVDDLIIDTEQDFQKVLNRMLSQMKEGNVSMKRLIRTAKGYNDFKSGPERDQFQQENEQFLKDNGWTEGYIGLYKNDKYPVFIDNNHGYYAVHRDWPDARYNEFMAFEDTAKQAIKWIDKNLSKILKEKAEDEEEGKELQEASKFLEGKGWQKSGDGDELNYSKDNFTIYYSGKHDGFSMVWRYGSGYYHNEYSRNFKTVEEVYQYYMDNKDTKFTEENAKKKSKERDEYDKTRPIYVD